MHLIYWFKNKEEFQLGFCGTSYEDPKYLLGIHKNTEDRIWGFSLLFMEFNFKY